MNRTKSIADSGPAIHSFSVDETLGTEQTIPQGYFPLFQFHRPAPDWFVLFCYWKRYAYAHIIGSW